MVSVFCMPTCKRFQHYKKNDRAVHEWRAASERNKTVHIRRTTSSLCGVSKFSSWMVQDATNAAAIPKYIAKCFISQSFLPIDIRIIPAADGFEVGLEERQFQICFNDSQGRCLIILDRLIRRAILHMRKFDLQNYENKKENNRIIPGFVLWGTGLDSLFQN